MDLTGSCFIFSAYVSVLTSVSAVSIFTSLPFSSLSRESRFLSRDLDRFLSRDRDRRDLFDFFDRDELRSLRDLSRLLLKSMMKHFVFFHKRLTFVFDFWIVSYFDFVFLICFVLIVSLFPFLCVHGAFHPKLPVLLDLNSKIISRFQAETFSFESPESETQ